MKTVAPLKLSDFHYELPKERIAQEPVSPRDQARLMVIDGDGRIAHHRFWELEQLLRRTDLLVLNSTRVFPARLRGRKATGGRVEVLLLNPKPGDRTTWRALVRGATSRSELQFADGLTAAMTDRLAEGEWWLRFNRSDVRDYLETHGEMPLPPYIKRPAARPTDRDRYQTVFAKTEGAVAAPTAGFHFTPDLLSRLDAKGIERQEVCLHVGWGTFRPVRTEAIEEHQMLPEWFEVPRGTAEAINRARAEGRRIVAVGTTVVRTLESAVDAGGTLRPLEGQTNLFIYPGYDFKVVDALITNFHLPDSTPILLASAFAAQRMKTDVPFALRSAYEQAVQAGYRFYSYGDAMLIQ